MPLLKQAPYTLTKRTQAQSVKHAIISLNYTKFKNQFEDLSSIEKENTNKICKRKLTNNIELICVKLQWNEGKK